MGNVKGGAVLGAAGSFADGEQRTEDIGFVVGDARVSEVGEVVGALKDGADTLESHGGIKMFGGERRERAVGVDGVLSVLRVPRAPPAWDKYR